MKMVSSHRPTAAPAYAAPCATAVGIDGHGIVMIRSRQVRTRIGIGMQHMTRIASACLMTVGALIGSAPTAGAQAARPVVIGSDGMTDACPAVARVTGLKRGGDNFLSVRVGPGIRHREADRIGPAALVHVCEDRGDWVGIVYAPAGRDVDCGVSSALRKPVAYRGPCRSGWVHRRFVEIIAG